MFIGLLGGRGEEAFGMNCHTAKIWNLAGVAFYSHLLKKGKNITLSVFADYSWGDRCVTNSGEYEQVAKEIIC